MKILVVGSGGREHAIIWKLKQSPRVEKIYCAPGNAGIGMDAELVDIGAMEFDKLVEFAKKNEIDLTVVGMDDPLYYRNKVHAAFGTGKGGSVLCGRYAAGSHYIVQTDDCLLENEQAQKIIRDIRDLAVSFRIPIYDEVRNKGCLRRVLRSWWPSRPRRWPSGIRRSLR